MQNIPHVIKYMGSKRKILSFIEDTVTRIKRPNQRFYDIFGGSAVVSGSFRDVMPVTCNDIQSYTSVLAGLYLNNYSWDEYPDNILELITRRAQVIVDDVTLKYSLGVLSYSGVTKFDDIINLENQEKKLIHRNFEGDNYLFVKFYSGTYWSSEQCAWIDAISAVAREDYKGTFLYNVILSGLMFAMSYCSQSTGHYAQYRDLTEENTSDVLLYRNKSILKLFQQKFNSLKEFFSNETNTLFDHRVSTKDYLDCINDADLGSLIYADPPYQFVHYSRFYHALETLVKYDYPQVQHKGRYRVDRHQSPFCIKTKVRHAFQELFNTTLRRECSLVISYSDNGMITLEGLLALANETFGNDYIVECEELDYIHSTMGRKADKSRKVKEILIIVRRL